MKSYAGRKLEGHATVTAKGPGKIGAPCQKRLAKRAPLARALVSSRALSAILTADSTRHSFLRVFGTVVLQRSRFNVITRSFSALAKLPEMPIDHRRRTTASFLISRFVSPHAHSEIYILGSSAGSLCHCRLSKATEIEEIRPERRTCLSKSSCRVYSPLASAEEATSAGK